MPSAAISPKRLGLLGSVLGAALVTLGSTDVISDIFRRAAPDVEHTASLAPAPDGKSITSAASGSRRLILFTAGARNLIEHRKVDELASHGHVTVAATEVPPETRDVESMFERQVIERLRLSEAAASVATSKIATGGIAPAEPCADVTATTTALPGGRLMLRAGNRCRPGQLWTVHYGALTFTRRLDQAGRGDFVLDLFQGRQEPVSVMFADGRRVAVSVPDPVPEDRLGLSKVAVVWHGNYRLDLHAFEFAAPKGGPGHVWSAAPGAADVAVSGGAAGRGRGFLSRMDVAGDPSGADPDGVKVQVYTFVHGGAQSGGSVALAVDYASRGALPAGETCGDGILAQPTHQIFRLDRNGTLRRQHHVLAPARCGQPLADQARFRTGALPDLRLRR
jgi:hypothetical protein